MVPGPGRCSNSPLRGEICRNRLAITIAGAVSLGSYEAGVLYEVLDAIHQHNCVPGTPDEERIEIDVLTGASAGAMTAAIVAQKMLYAADEFRDPYDNPLYNVWVKQINLAGLLNTTNGGCPGERVAAAIDFFVEYGGADCGG